MSAYRNGDTNSATLDQMINAPAVTNPASVPPSADAQSTVKPLTTIAFPGHSNTVQTAIRALSDFDFQARAISRYNALPYNDKPQNLKQVISFSTLELTPVSRAAAASLQHAAAKQQALLLQVLFAQYFPSGPGIFTVNPLTSCTSKKTFESIVDIPSCDEHFSCRGYDPETPSPRDEARFIAANMLRVAKKYTESIQEGHFRMKGCLKVRALKTAVSAAMSTYLNDNLTKAEHMAYQRQLQHYLAKATLRLSGGGQLGKAAETLSDMQNWITGDGPMAYVDDNDMPRDDMKTKVEMWIEFCVKYVKIMTTTGSNDKRVIQAVKKMAWNLKGENAVEQQDNLAKLKKTARTMEEKRMRMQIFTYWNGPPC